MNKNEESLDGEVSNSNAVLGNGTLPSEEQKELERCENLFKPIPRGFVTAGSALLVIRKARLYRATHQTFEAYCKDRLGRSLSYVWRIISAAERFRLLPEANNLPRPLTESQIRPFLKLKAEVFPEAWQQAVARAKGGRITSEIIESVVDEFLPSGQTHRSYNRTKSPRIMISRTVTVGEVMMLLHTVKRRIETGQNEQALAILERLESILLVTDSAATTRNRHKNS